MQIAAAQLSEHVKNGLRTLYTLHGDETLLVQEAADALREAARLQGYSERTVHTVSGANFDWSEVLASGGSLSLFADKKILEIRIPGGKPGKDGSVALQQLAERTQGDETMLTLVMLPKLDSMTAKSAWFDALGRFGITVRFESIERRDLPSWIAQRLQQQGQRVAAGEEGQRALQFFADQVEGNLLAAHQEIQKLGLLYPAGPDGAPEALGFDQIENAVLNVARYDVFKLSEAVLGGQVARVARMLDGLQSEGVSEVLVHWALAEDIRTMKRVKDALQAGRPMPMALREHRVWGAREKLYERVLPHISSVTLANLLQAAHKVDGLIKGLKQPDWPLGGWQALQRLAGMVCIACMPPGPARGARS